MSPALAYRYEDLESEDRLSDVEKMSVECPCCDEDSPICIPRKICPTCKGTGRAPLALSTVVRELKASRSEPTTKGSRSSDDDLYLEY